MSGNLPEDLAGRLAAEAARRGVSVDDVAAELLAAQLPADDALEAFIGCGASGQAEPFDVQQARQGLAARRLAGGA